MSEEISKTDVRIGGLVIMVLGLYLAFGFEPFRWDSVLIGAAVVLIGFGHFVFGETFGPKP